jgi:uncharacterized membrane protein YdjX (TVP38/TMEM64 family)
VHVRSLAETVCRYGWVALGLVVLTVEATAIATNNRSLTSTFRRAVTDTGWRWPVLLLVLLLVAHLFMPPAWRQYDPVDRLFYRFSGRPPTG